MVKVTRPLFSDAASGKVGGIGSFRNSPKGAQFITITRPVDRKTDSQNQIRNQFKTALLAWSLLDKHSLPTWPDYWRTWLIDHSEL